MVAIGIENRAAGTVAMVRIVGGEEGNAEFPSNGDVEDFVG